MLIDSPVGTSQERMSSRVWPGSWFDATPFGMRYQVVPGRWARHTGADLNLSRNADAGVPIYAIADGVVTASRLGQSSWGWVIVIEHKDDNGKLFYSRYAHVNHIQYPVVQKGQSVTIGTVIALVGNADGIYGSGGHHLHFDISHTKVLKTRPEHWPGDVSEAKVRRNYSDPRRFIMENRTQPDPIPDDATTEKMKVITTSLRIRPAPNLLEDSIGFLSYGNIVEVRGSFSANGYHFAEIVKLNGADFQSEAGQKGYTAREFLQPVS
ncbi:MAG: M23 family metallopeptidase [Anaerolineae bacterium]